ncbi:phosphotransferase [Mycoplasma struthionis]|uniref:Aminoglycoside phosphotransferase domain-containing protein n=1 Tax=Mycoplasma struthionis TaxID=538220 RepID=A0A3G8LG11_9MOLU|nr:phosphotransferase [Mycoplasma struthionis]AZG68441.1 hypothetical protein EGN60_00400 [Mycoplasma struthionis]TPI02815.1 hypothetical protein FJM01_00275 [Mycoplasma struthionis]
MLKKLENQGFTNITFKDEQNNLFVKEKKYDGFNHKTDYFLLNSLSFAPEVISDDKEYLKTKWIEGNILLESTITNQDLKEIGQKLIELHNSKLKFAKENQIARRFKVYREKIAALNRKIPVLDKHYKKINLFLKNIDTSAPTHNDLWLFNMIKNEKGIYITDWEYSSMGDVHFDLAYFCETSNLTKEQEEVFFEGYGDDYEPKYLLVHRIIVNALVVLWINKEEIKPFDDQMYIDRVEKYMKEYLEKYA